ncbi:transposase [Deinococcus saxicola]|uniref:transposase n=1 Tax=Deinococcus saxicola TaxID=249406 RepID=UPI0039EF8EE1
MRATQAAYLQVLLVLWLVVPGRLNFINLTRYGGPSERTHRVWFQKPLPWVELNTSLILQMQDQECLGSTSILGIDAVFINKNGRCTPGVAQFWSGGQQRSLSGLEGSCVTWVDLETQQPFPLSISQTPADLPGKQTRTNVYAQDTLNTLAQLPAAMHQQVQAVVGDAYYARKKFVDPVVDEGQLPFVGKLRRDAHLKHLFAGPMTARRGRPKKYDGKVSLSDFSRWNVLPWTDACTAYTTVVYAVALKRAVRVVALLWPGKSGMTLELLFSTDPSMDAATIVRLYRARFALEFPFRDGKQFAGLNDCQSRQAQALHFHWNMALHSVSVARASQLMNQRASPLVFSMEDEKRRAYNEFFADRLLSMLPGDLTCEKIGPRITDLLLLGVKAA